MSDPNVWSRRDAWCAVLLALVATVVVILAITPHPAGVFQDDGVYVVLAKALAQGDGYRYINLPNAPGATHFPPLYPILLAGLWKIGPAFPANIPLFKFANALLLGIATAGAFTFARRILDMTMWTAAFTAAVACISAPLVGISRMVLSEPMFLAALFPVLFLAERSTRDEGTRRALLAGLLAGALGLIRSLGMFLVPAIAVLFLTRRRWRHAALVLVGGAMALAPWQFWSAAHSDTLAAPLAGKYGSYSSWLVDGMREGGVGYLATVARENTEFTGTFLAGTFGLSTAPIVAQYTVIILVVAFLALGARELWRQARVTTLFLAVYVSVVLLWPFPPARFYWGIWPLLVFGFALGVRGMWRSQLLTARRYRPAYAVAVAALGAMYMGPQTLGIPRPWVWHIQGIMTERSRAVVHWVNANAAPNDIVATEDDLLVYLYTGRVTVPLIASLPREHAVPQTREFARTNLDTLLRTYPVRWVIPVTWLAFNASTDLSRTASARIALHEKLSLGAVFESAPGTY